MDQEQFTIGSTVALRSGGPAMTIQAINDESIDCLWFDEAEVRSAVFPRLTLESVTLSESLELDEDEEEDEEEYEDEVVGY